MASMAPPSVSLHPYFSWLLGAVVIILFLLGHMQVLKGATGLEYGQGEIFEVQASEF